MSTEAWLEGPLEGVDPYLMPVAQALVQVGRDLERLAGLAPETLWARPGGAASVGFHIRHVAGVLDRLSTYARGEALGEEQMKALRAEGEPGDPPADAAGLVREARAAVERALAQVRVDAPRGPPRAAGRRPPAAAEQRPRPLLHHAAEHAVRHTGQALTTAKIANP